MKFPEDIKKEYPIGSILFVARLLANSFITKYTVIGYEMVELGNEEISFFKVECDYETTISVRDCGIIPNTFNQHQTFKTLAEAEAYVESTTYVNRCNLGFDYDWDLGFDYDWD